VQVFLRGMLLPSLHGHTVRICFPWQPPLTVAEVKGQIAPLLPLVARCTVEGLSPGSPITLKGPTQVSTLDCDANKGIALIVDCTKGYQM
jgi:hypothetical protein